MNGTYFQVEMEILLLGRKHMWAHGCFQTGNCMYCRFQIRPAILLLTCVPFSPYTCSVPAQLQAFPFL